MLLLDDYANVIDNTMAQYGLRPTEESQDWNLNISLCQLSQQDMLRLGEMYMHADVRACVRAFVRSCVRACMPIHSAIILKCTFITIMLVSTFEFDFQGFRCNRS